jgi:hypothetical protein
VNPLIIIDVGLTAVQALHAAKRSLLKAERNHHIISQLVLQAPAAMGLLQGPSFVYELVNPNYQQLVADWALIGK